MKEAIIQYNDAPSGGYMAISLKPLIRCKECKHGELLFADYVSCQISDENESGCHASHKPEWFCADGERREFVKPPTGSATDWDGVECE